MSDSDLDTLKARVTGATLGPEAEKPLREDADERPQSDPSAAALPTDSSSPLVEAQNPSQ